jgi:hypothetical protein
MEVLLQNEEQFIKLLNPSAYLPIDVLEEHTLYWVRGRAFLDVALYTGNGEFLGVQHENTPRCFDSQTKSIKYYNFLRLFTEYYYDAIPSGVLPDHSSKSATSHMKSQLKS